MSVRAVLGQVLSLAFCLSFVGASCGQKSLAVMPGVLNDPGNHSLRRALFSYAQGQICKETQKRSVPIKLRADDPATGRFFPTSCSAKELENENLSLQFGGHGYAWSNLTKRVSFDAGGTVEYQHDFLMDGSTMYVYFRQKSTSATTFTTRLVEQTPPSLPGMAGGSTQGFLDTVGAQILKNELARGFTVIRDSDGHVDFGLGVVEKGKRPASPYRIEPGTGRMVLANERSEVHQNQREHAGPFEVTGKGQALYLSVAIDGAPAIDVLVVQRGLGEAWLTQYTTTVAPTPPPAAPVLDEAVTMGMVWRRTVPLPAGQYYVVFDNTAAAGRTAPAGQGNDDRAALVSYAVELGDAP
ncbi:hypothetical protein [Polyangium aurulentum]|uniref:hypothetical protein n=1 Tax=Polyangium aurulentum TaxID=2567896 RepID=UPI0010AEBBB4|nr:hypothetical protein [Polyangium aurulentum]UQA62335.1 hypothetical protein E8A73_018455 [Polyangium aurulentum]